MFVPLTLREKPTMKRLDHSCEAPYIRELAVVDVKGLFQFFLIHNKSHIMQILLYLNS